MDSGMIQAITEACARKFAQMALWLVLAGAATGGFIVWAVMR